jgi:hypothetical protein
MLYKDIGDVSVSNIICLLFVFHIEIPAGLLVFGGCQFLSPPLPLPRQSLLDLRLCAYPPDLHILLDAMHSEIIAPRVEADFDRPLLALPMQCPPVM